MFNCGLRKSTKHVYCNHDSRLWQLHYRLSDQITPQNIRFIKLNSRYIFIHNIFTSKFIVLSFYSSF